MNVQSPRCQALRRVAPALLSLCAYNALATDSYIAASRQLTMPSLQVGQGTYSNVVVNVGSIITPPSGTAPNGSIDSYDPASGLLTVQSVTAGGATYYNVTATVTGLVSIGSVSGVDTYDGTQLTIPTVVVQGGATYTGAIATPGTILSVGGGLPLATTDQYDAANNQLTVPAVLDEVNGRVYTNVRVTLASVQSVTASPSAGTPPGVAAAAFNSNGTTTIAAGAQGAWYTYAGGSGQPIAGSNGGYADKGISPTYEYVFIIPTAAEIAGGFYTYQGITVAPPSGRSFSTTGYDALGFTAQVNPEWLKSAGGSANFAVLITANVGSQTGCVAVAVVSATSAGVAIPFVVPLAAFDYIEPEATCNASQLTPAQVVAGTITAIDFQAVGGSGAFTASGLTTNINTTTLNQSGAQNYPTTLTIFGGVEFVSNGRALAPAIMATTGGGAQNGAVIVSLHSAAANTTVYYTIDGSTPTTSSAVYLAPFLVASNLTVKAIAAGPGFAPSPVSSRVFAPNIPSGTLVWSDEFTNTTGAPAPPDPATWTYDTGNSGFGNGELENYCAWGSNSAPCAASSPNAFVGTDGYLHIVAQQPSPLVYTSARLKSQGLFSFQYGRYEARIKVPEEKGLWPAAWLMGNNIALVSWPACGEMDVQERVNGPVMPQDVNYGSIHGPGFIGSAISATYDFPAGQTAGGAFHTYGMIWAPGTVSYYIDNPATPYAVNTIATTQASNPGSIWPFDAGANFMLLNLAVGGGFPGNPDGTTSFPATTLIDYVRIYAN